MHVHMYTLVKYLKGHLTDSLMRGHLFFTAIATITTHNIKITITRAAAITESTTEFEDESSESSIDDITVNHKHTLTKSGVLL